jgi:hypothetical protein
VIDARGGCIFIRLLCVSPNVPGKNPLVGPASDDGIQSHDDSRAMASVLDSRSKVYELE